MLELAACDSKQAGSMSHHSSSGGSRDLNNLPTLGHRLIGTRGLKRLAQPFLN